MILTLALTLITQTAVAEPRTLPDGQIIHCRPGAESKDPSDKDAACSARLLEGHPAPFGGVLLTPRLGAEIGAVAADCARRIDLTTQTSSVTCHLMLTHEARLHQIQTDSMNSEIQGLRNVEGKLQAQVDRRSSFLAPAVAGFAAGVISSIAIFFLAK